MDNESKSKYKEKLVCRTCLKIVHGASYKIQDKCDASGEDGTRIAQVLRFIVPELYLGLSASPEICFKCKESVRIAYSFRKQCLQTENLIGSYLKAASCTAPVIDLYSVLEFSGNTDQKAHHAVQTLISDWEDDSSDDNSSELTNKPATEVSSRPEVPLDVKKCFVPTCSNTDANSSKIFIKVPQRGAMKRIWCSAAGISVPKTMPSYVFCCEDHFNMQEDCENWMDFKMNNVQIRMKPGAKPHLNLKGHYMKTIEKYHSQLSPTSRKRRMENDQFGKMNTPDFVEEVPSRSVDIIPQTAVLAPREIPVKKFTKIQLPPISSNHTVAGEMNQQKANTKILFRNVNEELCIIGCDKWIERNEQMNEDEIDKEVVQYAEPDKQTEPINNTKPQKQKENEPTDIPKESYLIICEETGLYKNKEGKYFNAALEAMNEIEVDAEKKKARIRGENFFEISDTCSVSDNFICEETGLFKNSKGEYFTECGKPLDVQSVEAEKLKAKIRGENLFQITDICSVPEEAVEQAEEVPEKTISSLDMSIEPPSPLEKLQKLVSSTESINCGDKSSNNLEMHEGRVDIKEEPLEMTIDEGRVEFNYVPEYDEETLTASESASYENLEGLLHSLDTYDTSQYVDVPEFVQINHFTLTDLENLKKQQQSLHDVTPNNLFSSQNAFTSLPYGEQTTENDINLKALLAGHSSLSPQIRLDPSMMEQVSFGGDLFVQSKQRCRLDTMPTHLSIEPLPELPTNDRIDDLNRSSIVKHPKILPSPPSGKRPARKPRRRKVKIIAVNENETNSKNSNANTSSPNREICVLFTNYSYDGCYINDHDYLMTPYKRNKILMKENGKSFCMCFICGHKHGIDEHVIHMNLHDPRCGICDVNLGTGYMLNLHVRTHTRPCRYCTYLVPYAEISEHQKIHREMELKYFNDTRRKRKKSDDEDFKPVHRSPSFGNYRISISPRLRRSSQVPSNEVDGMQVKIVNENNVDSDKTDVNATDIENVGTIINIEEKNAETNNVEKNNVEAGTINIEEKNVETSNVEKNNVEAGTINIEEKNVETNNVEKNNVEAGTINIEEKNVGTNNVEKSNVEAGTINIEEKNTGTSNVEKNNAEANNLEEIHVEVEETNVNTDYCETNYNNTTEANSFVKISSECSEAETNKDDSNISTMTDNTDAKIIEMTENELTKPKKLYSRRKRSRKIEMLSKEECNLEEKLLKICEKSKERADKRVLRSSFVKESSECSEMKKSANGDMPGNKCCFLNCELTKRIDPTIRLHRFPIGDDARCQKWIKHSGNTALADISPISLRNRHICSRHFKKQKYRIAKLPSDAVPFHYSTGEWTNGADSTDDNENFEDTAPKFNASSVLRSYPVREKLSNQPSCSHTV